MVRCHSSLVHFIAKGKAVGEVARTVESGLRRRRILVLGGMGCQSSLSGKGIVIRDAVLRSNMLKDLLVDLTQLRGRIREPMSIVGPEGGMGEVRLVLLWRTQTLDVPIAAVRRACQALGVRASTVSALTLPLVRSVVV